MAKRVIVGPLLRKSWVELDDVANGNATAPGAAATGAAALAAPREL